MYRTTWSRSGAAALHRENQTGLETNVDTWKISAFITQVQSASWERPGQRENGDARQDGSLWRRVSGRSNRQAEFWLSDGKMKSLDIYVRTM